jgi:glucose/arabinose dehydrogenase
LRAALLPALGLLAALLACSAPAAAPNSGPAARQATPTAEEEEESEGPKPGSAPTATARPLPTTVASGLKTELIVEGLQLPQSMAFAADGRLFFVEVKRGDVRVLDGKVLQEQPVLTVRVPRGGEQGLIGLALDPGFDRNHYLYTFYTQAQKGVDVGRARMHRLTRWTEHGGSAGSETSVLGDLPFGKCCHTGGKLAFAPDGSLFLALGDQGDLDRQQAQNPSRLNGKLLHLDVERVMREHPDPLTLVYAGGLRNPYGLDIHPITGAPFLMDNGPDRCDELNLMREGANYGSPVVACAPHDPRFEDPIWESGPDRLGVTGLAIYRGSMFPEYANHPLFCSVNTGNLMHAVLEAPGYDKVERVDQVVSGQDGEGCRLGPAIAPDGSIYYASMTKIFRVYR